jgi:hypothetical protein
MGGLPDPAGEVRFSNLLSSLRISGVFVGECDVRSFWQELRFQMAEQSCQKVSAIPTASL